MKVGDEVKFLDNIIKFKSLNSSNEKNYKKLIGEFELTNKQASQFFYPEIRVYNQPKTITYEASINSNLFSDTYLTMSNISDSDIFNIKFQKKPFMNFIWLSVLLISCGGILNLFNRKKET